MDQNQDDSTSTLVVTPSLPPSLPRTLKATVSIFYLAPLLPTCSDALAFACFAFR